MKCTIKENGTLQIYAKNNIESYALSNWCDNNQDIIQTSKIELYWNMTKKEIKDKMYE